jgi:hypothetical protein
MVGGEFHDCFKAFMILPVQPSACSHINEQEQMVEAFQKRSSKALACSKRTCLSSIVDEYKPHASSS